MPITVVTIDFWNTLFDSTGGTHRNAARRQALHDAIIEAGVECELERLESAFGELWGYFDDHWLNRQRTPTSEEMVREVYRRLELEIAEEAIMNVADIFSRGVLDHPPSLFPGVREGLAYLRERANLALISDTAFSPGSVLKELMEQNGIAQFFDTFVFSDETGVAKPHPTAFLRALAPFDAPPHHAVHIGDIERTDIIGAKRAGMRAILYKGEHDTGDHTRNYAEEETIADAILNDWSALPDVFEQLVRTEADARV